MVDLLRLRSAGVGDAVVRRAFDDRERPWELTWQECREVFDASGGPFSYGLAEPLARSGWTSVDIIHDLEPLRAAWIREHGPLPSAGTQSQNLAIAAIERFRPRVVLDVNLKVFTTRELRALRERFPFIERTIGQVNTMKRLDRAFGHDLVLTPSRGLARVLERAGGPPTRTFHHAFDPQWVSGVPQEARDRVIFTGSTGRGRYSERTRVLAALLEADLVEAYIDEGKTDSFPTVPAGMRRFRSRTGLATFVPLGAHARFASRTGRGAMTLDARLRGDADLVPAVESGHEGLPFVGLRAAFPERCHGPVFGSDMFALLGSSLAAVHHTIETSTTALRHFEATGMGAALVTNSIEGLDEVFEVGTEVLAYRDRDEALEMVRWIIDDPAGAARIGDAGRRRTLEDHSVSARAAQLASILEELVGGPGADVGP